MWLSFVGKTIWNERVFVKCDDCMELRPEGVMSISLTVKNKTGVASTWNSGKSPLAVTAVHWDELRVSPLESFWETSSYREIGLKLLWSIIFRYRHKVFGKNSIKILNKCRKSSDFQFFGILSKKKIVHKMLKVSDHGGSKVLVIGCRFVASTCVHRGRHVWGPFRGSPRCPTSLRFAKIDQLLEPPLPD